MLTIENVYGIILYRIKHEAIDSKSSFYTKKKYVNNSLASGKRKNNILCFKNKMSNIFLFTNIHINNKITTLHTDIVKQIIALTKYVNAIA